MSSKHKEFKVWQDGNHPEEVFRLSFTKQKLNYIHQNPVREMIVSDLLEVELLNTGIDKPFYGSSINS